MIYAAGSDLEAVWRTLTDAEYTVAGSLLDQASVKLRALVPNLDERVSSDPDTAALARAAVVNAVKRVMLNPEGRRQFSRTAGIFTDSGTLSDASAAGTIVFTADDLLGLTRSAGTFLGTARVRSGYPPVTR